MWKEFRVAVSFLTTLPLKYKGEWDEKAFSRSAIFYPVVGFIIGSLTALSMFLMSFTGYLSVAAFVSLLVAIVLSGGLHLDGYMDMCDGLLASRGREKALEIMKDSRVGSFAVIGVILLLLGKYVMYGTLLTTPVFVVSIIAGLTLSRLILNFCLLFFPCARKEGLAVLVQKYVPKSSLWVGLILLALLVGLTQSWFLIPAIFITLLIILLITQAINKFLQGITGDIHGAMCELSELLFLLLVIIFYAIMK